VIVLFQPARET